MKEKEQVHVLMWVACLVAFMLLSALTLYVYNTQNNVDVEVPVTVPTGTVPLEDVDEQAGVSDTEPAIAQESLAGESMASENPDVRATTSTSTISRPEDVTSLGVEESPGSQFIEDPLANDVIFIPETFEVLPEETPEDA